MPNGYGLNRDAYPGNTGKMLFESFRTRSNAAFFDYQSISVQNGVMAELIAKIDAYGQHAIRFDGFGFHRLASRFDLECFGTGSDKKYSSSRSCGKMEIACDFQAA